MHISLPLRKRCRRMELTMKTLILGMGNPILSDDGVGLALAAMLRNKIRGADVAASAMIGLSLFDLIIGYDTIFIIECHDHERRKDGRTQEDRRR